MGVTVLQQFPMVENRTGPQTIEFLTKRVVALGAVQSGHFLVDCETYMSVATLVHTMYICKYFEDASGNYCGFVEGHLPTEAFAQFEGGYTPGKQKRPRFLN